MLSTYLRKLKSPYIKYHQLIALGVENQYLANLSSIIMKLQCPHCIDILKPLPTGTYKYLKKTVHIESSV